MKIHFHAVFGKNEEDFWSLVEIFKLITPDMFEGVFQNYRYSVVRENNVLCGFTVVEFPLMNPNDVIMLTKIMEDMIIGYGHTKSFLDCYIANLALTDFELANVYNKKSKVTKSLIEGIFNINDYEDGEITNHPFGVIFT